MQTQDFHKLARPVQDRLIGCLNGSGLPAPTLAVRGGPVSPWGWLLVAGACAVGTGVAYRMGLGALGSSLAIQDTKFLGVYAGLLSCAVFAVLRAGALFQETRALPFRPGVYLFPIGVVDARRYVLKIYPIDDLVSSEGPSAAHAFVLKFKGGASFDLRAKNAELAKAAADVIAGARGEVAAAADQPGSLRPRAMAALDPLQGFVNPLAPTTSLERSAAPWARYGWLIAPVVGLALGACLWLVRNVVSDDRMFARALAQGDAPALRAYLVRGSRHRDEIEAVLLPRAELKEAQEKGTVDAIEAYIAAHPKTGIAPEIDAALRVAMIDALERAKRVGTVTALKAFAQKHPNHRLEPELKAATHAVYVGAFEKWKKDDAPKDPAAVAFIEKLVAWAEQKGPKVELRFHRKGSRSLEKAETAISRSRYFMGIMSFPGRYYDAPHMKPREDECAKELVGRFNQAFPKDVLEMTLGAPVDDPEAALPPSVSVPTWFVEYSMDWDGGLRTSDRPRGVFIGLGFGFEAIFRLPDETKPSRFKTGAIWRAPKLDALPADAHPEEKLYADMGASAFDAFTKKALSTLFAAK
jgi:hypothetical protein